MLTLVKYAALFALTALAEILGCYDLIGAGLALAGMAVIALQPQS
jgi:drug/metabolite transporter superfamily protein YnfA